MFIPGIPFRLLKCMTLPSSTLSSPSLTHPSLFFLFLLTTGVHFSYSSLPHIPHAHLPLPHLTATSPHSAKQTSSSLSVASSLLPPGDCGSLEDNRQEAGPWCTSIGLHHGSPKTKVEAGAIGWVLLLSLPLLLPYYYFFLEPFMHSRRSCEPDEICQDKCG